MKPVVELKKVGKLYGEETLDGNLALWAVREVSFTLQPGELTLLVGPSGSGKTTVLTMIGGLLQPTEGSINVCETELNGLAEPERNEFRRSQIGFVFQTYNLLSALTARENIVVALQLRGADTAEADELLEAVGMEGREGAYPAELSGGQRQRIAIARALAGNPQLLLADEPTAALDAVQGVKVIKLLRERAHESGTAVLVVTHDPRVRPYADRILEMEDGRVRRMLRRTA